LARTSAVRFRHHSHGVVEGQDKLGDDAHRFYDTLIRLSADTTHIEHINNFWATADRGGLTKR
jgi:hypothetical protein